ncbi:retrotransposon protein, putative, ty1-copia subclass [Tanacetum coccineum]|uniref:Retrotransposon protein, putative, ty1-copia subclass n=1 Tax=Tanacetum coccineum TaxID=301880 RepID=A0ABQ5HVH7_9ASTR
MDDYSVGNNSVFRFLLLEIKNSLDPTSLIVCTTWTSSFLEAHAAPAAWVKGQKGKLLCLCCKPWNELLSDCERLSHFQQEKDTQFAPKLNYERLRAEFISRRCGRTVNELHAMLKLKKETQPKKAAKPALQTIQPGRYQQTRKINRTKLLRVGLVKFDDGFVNRFDDNNVISVSKDNLVYFMAVPRDGIFEIDMSCSNTNDSSMYAITNKRAKINLDSSLLWHCRLGHISKKRIEKLQHDGLLNSIDIESLGKCVSCLSGKMARKPYSHQVERAKDLLGLIHTDVCGPFRIVSRQGASYFVTFTDDFSRYGYVYLLKHKHEVFETFKVFQKEVENQLGKTIKSLRSDRGGEYMSQEFLDHLKEHGIIAHRTPPYTPQNNGVSERRNRTLLDMVRSMMSQTTLPKSFWDYALETAARILNMVPTKKVDKTPYEIWHGQAPKLSYLRVWGCEAFVKHDTLTKPDKLDPRSFKSIFIGYPKETMGYSFYSPSENKVFVARNAEFFESKLLDLKASGSVEDLELIQEEDTNPSVETSLNHEEDDQEIDEPQSDINPIRRSTRTRRPTDRLCLYIDTEEHELGDLGEPANYRAALLDPESKKWLDAMNVEMQSMKDNDVWVLVELPPNARTVGSKWLFKKKTDMDGAVYIFKARLVAKGFTQTYGVDYKETFSPVADIRAIRILIAIAAYYDYEIWQMDVKTAFLNGHLSEEVYMEQPEASGSYVAILILYVDDILLMGNNIPMLQDVKSYLGRSFAMKDLGDAAYILGIKIYRDRKLKLSKSQGASTPAEKQRMQNIPYASAIGYIIWICVRSYGGVAVAGNVQNKVFLNLIYRCEYIAAFDASKEVIALAKVIGVTKGEAFSRKKFHYLRETIKMGDFVRIEKIDTDVNLARTLSQRLWHSLSIPN